MKSLNLIGRMENSVHLRQLELELSLPFRFVFFPCEHDFNYFSCVSFVTEQHERCFIFIRFKKTIRCNLFYIYYYNVPSGGGHIRSVFLRNDALF